MEQKRNALPPRIQNLVIASAKQALMENRNFTEQQAHRYIQKQSMDHRVCRAQAAQMILRSLRQPRKN